MGQRTGQTVKLSPKARRRKAQERKAFDAYAKSQNGPVIVRKS